MGATVSERYWPRWGRPQTFSSWSSSAWTMKDSGRSRLSTENKHIPQRPSSRVLQAVVRRKSWSPLPV